MAKLSPVNRWNRRNLERIKALRLSGDVIRIRRKGLASLGRTRMYSFQEWWDDFHNRATSQKYLEWYRKKCSPVADRFGLSPWVVANMCLLKGYQPENDIGLIVVEADWPRVRLVTNSTDEAFLKKLSYEAKEFGIYIIQDGRAVQNPELNPDALHNGDLRKVSRERPRNRDAFFLRVETPIEYPPEAAAELHRASSQTAKEIARRMGYPVPKRLRNSKLVPLSEGLMMVKRRLPRGGSYDVADRIYGDSDLQEDQRKRKSVSSRRYKLRQRLTMPYETREHRQGN